ncbi:DUF559 domain-containing protein [Aquipuribacter nitratireducens]|uniref:DUF559 domain-containing protein n=1 Tax=Aquipuribacter nitratireducens TaxID=650104 RepID=A0ABW0GP23_9MICO
MGVRDRVWTRERARREGVSERVLTGGVEFVRVVPGHYVEACWAEDLLTRCAAAVEAVPSAVVSHWTALELEELPVPPDEVGRLHVTVPPTMRRRTPGLVVHRSAVRPVTADEEVPVSGPCRAWCDAAALAGPAPGHEGLARLVAVADVLLRSDAARHVVVRLLEARRGGRGTDVAARALTLVDTRAESPRESWLRVLLVLEGLAPEAVQHTVTDRRGRFVARVDLAYPSRRVVVEYDGDHHRDRRQWQADLGRRERLEAAGWRVVVLTGRDLVDDPRRVVARVRAALG